MDEVRKLKLWEDLGPHVFLDECPIVAIVANNDGTIFWANRTSVTWFGYSRLELVGKPLEILIPEEKRHAHQGYFASWVRNPCARTMGNPLNTEAMNKFGEPIGVTITLAAIETTVGVLPTAWMIKREASK